jgi:ParB family chromosome partitioning protein
MAKKKVVRRRKKVQPASVGLAATDTKTTPSGELQALAEQVEQDGGAVLAAYRDPFGGKDVLLVALPIDRIDPTPYQRDPSDPHVKRLMAVIEKIGQFLDPVIAATTACRRSNGSASDRSSRCCCPIRRSRSRFSR